MKLNNTQNLNYIEIIMCLTLVVNLGHLVESLHQLAKSSIAREGISFANDPFFCSSSFEVLPQCQYLVNLSVSLP